LVEADAEPVTDTVADESDDALGEGEEETTVVGVTEAEMNAEPETDAVVKTDALTLGSTDALDDVDALTRALRDTETDVDTIADAVSSNVPVDVRVVMGVRDALLHAVALPVTLPLAIYDPLSRSDAEGVAVVKDVPEADTADDALIVVKEELEVQ
jgi:hypothetical protein